MGMKNAQEPQLTMMEKVSGRLKESIQKVKSKIYEENCKFQKVPWQGLPVVEISTIQYMICDCRSSRLV